MTPKRVHPNLTEQLAAILISVVGVEPSITGSATYRLRALAIPGYTRVLVVTLLAKQAMKQGLCPDDLMIPDGVEALRAISEVLKSPRTVDLQTLQSRLTIEWKHVVYAAERQLASTYNLPKRSAT